MTLVPLVDHGGHRWVACSLTRPNGAPSFAVVSCRSCGAPAGTMCATLDERLTQGPGPNWRMPAFFVHASRREDYYRSHPKESPVPDERIRRLEREYATTGNLEDLDRLDRALRQAGQDAPPRAAAIRRRALAHVSCMLAAHVATKELEACRGILAADPNAHARLAADPNACTRVAGRALHLGMLSYQADRLRATMLHGRTATKNC